MNVFKKKQPIVSWTAEGKGTRAGLRGEKQVAAVPGHPLVRWRVRGSD